MTLLIELCLTSNITFVSGTVYFIFVWLDLTQTQMARLLFLFSLLFKKSWVISEIFIVVLCFDLLCLTFSLWKRMLCLAPLVPSRQLRPFLPDRKLPQEQEFMVNGAREPRVFLRQWSTGPRHCQEFSFSTQLDCKLLEYRNLTHLQLLQPCVLQVELSWSYWFHVFLIGKCGNKLT